MPKVIYDMTVIFWGETPETITNLETTSEFTEGEIAEVYLQKLEATLEKIETGKRGVLRIGGRVIPVSDERVPSLTAKIQSVIQDRSADGLHNPEG